MGTVYAWHFLDESGKAHGNYEPPPVGTMEKVGGAIELCSNGLHGSRLPLDALSYCGGARFVRRTVHSGEVVEGDAKIASSQRTALWQADATMVLHEFACWCAEEALKLVVPDPRSVRAIEVKRLWIAGRATDGELAAARAAAWAAARDAAGAAAWAAAWAAARAAAWAAARDAARAAAWDAARAAAWDAAGATQNKQLHKMLLALGKVTP